jgi:hypothetical protein
MGPESGLVHDANEREWWLRGSIVSPSDKSPIDEEEDDEEEEE